MKIKILSISIILTLVVPTCSTFDEETKKAETLEIFKGFKTELQSELKQAITAGGTVNAIGVCAQVSPEMEKRVSEEHGLTLKRVSDNYRNPSHVPDEIENKTIQRWKDEMSQGMKPAVYTQKSNGEFRVIAPIIIDNATCLKCHGSESEIDRATLEKIQVVYPDDKAKGYKMGDVRGAFSASWKI